MKLITIGLALLIVIGVGVGLYSAKAQSNQLDSSRAPGNSEQMKKASEPIIDDFEGVEVVATWEKAPEGRDTQDFTVQLNNHEVDLDNFDFNANILMEINGILAKAKVINIQQSGAGHHVGSQIKVQGPEFTQLKTGDKLTLIIKNVLDSPDRRFTWTY